MYDIFKMSTLDFITLEWNVFLIENIFSNNFFPCQVNEQNVNQPHPE